jgi:hypothetical protein
MASPNSTFTSGAILTAAQMNNLPFGRVATPVNITTSQGSITSLVDVTGATLTFTGVANRLYKANWRGFFSSTVATDVFNILLTDNSNNIQDQFLICPATTSDVSYHAEFIFTPGAGSITRKLRIQRQSGSGTGSLTAGATFPLQCWIEDIGIA